MSIVVETIACRQKSRNVQDRSRLFKTKAVVRLLKLGCHCDTPVCHFSTGPLTKLVLNGFKLTI